jgi:hypothetical protein
VKNIFVKTGFCGLLMFMCVFALPAFAQRLSSMAVEPDWGRLAAFERTITRAEFIRLLDTVYAPGGAWNGVIEVGEWEAVIYKTLTPPSKITLAFAADELSKKTAPRWWRTVAEIRRKPGAKPLDGVRLVLDPGHIGGKWGLMEERSFALPGDKPVQEGDMTLLVCQLAAKELRALGASVFLTREAAVPTSPFTVDALRPQGRKELELFGAVDIRENYDGPRDPMKAQTVQWQAEKLFYRVAEIRERARIVNEKLRPDLVVCVHFNADDWMDSAAPVFTDRNDLHTLVHGCLSAGEMRFDDQRFEMLLRLLSGSHGPELAAAGAVNDALVKETGLPPFSYLTGNAIRVNDNSYIWARNLLANRLFECPVVFLEPYRMNHADAYARMQAGDFAGEREIGGRMQKSIFREYAAGIVRGLVSAFAGPESPVDR